MASQPAPAAAQHPTDVHLVGSTVAEPVPGSWLSGTLGITLSEAGELWPRMGSELTLAADRWRVDGAWADVGGSLLAVRVGRFRVPVGRANSAPIGEEALISRPVALDQAFGGTLAATGGLVRFGDAGLSLRGGLADGGNDFFGGGQIGILRGEGRVELPGGAALDLGVSGATNQIAGVAGADATLTWHDSRTFGALVAAEGFAGLGNWRTGAARAVAGHGVAAASYGPLEAAIRLDVALPGADSGPLLQGVAVAYGMRIAPRALLRLELSRRAELPRLFGGLAGDRVLAQLVFALGGGAGQDGTEGARGRR
ncbi:MAG: hypothetical protein FJZ01_02700 [Candidatus Sericytochromatia bacterium]|nr:hypothetical protein [Candidatus Tanganyikabacteria bacterium]